MTDVPVSQDAREARIARYLSNEKAARESLATYPESTRQRLEAWQAEQCEWFSDTILEIVAEFITIDDAIRQQAERGDEVEAVAELQLAAFLAGRGSVTGMKHGTRTAKPAPTMDQFRQMARAALGEKP